MPTGRLHCLFMTRTAVSHVMFISRRTLPPFFMPMTPLDSACGGAGPAAPENSELPPSLYLTCAPDTGSPTMNSYGCTAQERRGVRVGWRGQGLVASGLTGGSTTLHSVSALETASTS